MPNSPGPVPLGSSATGNLRFITLLSDSNHRHMPGKSRETGDVSGKFVGKNEEGKGKEEGKMRKERERRGKNEEGQGKKREENGKEREGKRKGEGREKGKNMNWEEL